MSTPSYASKKAGSKWIVSAYFRMACFVSCFAKLSDAERKYCHTQIHHTTRCSWQYKHKYTHAHTCIYVQCTYTCTYINIPCKKLASVLLKHSESAYSKRCVITHTITPTHTCTVTPAIHVHNHTCTITLHHQLQ